MQWKDLTKLPFRKLEGMQEILSKYFVEKFQLNPTIIIRSPGRVNIIGEHTDYNNGFVLPAAIDKAAYIAISLRADDQIHLHAIDLHDAFDTTIADIKPLNDGHWANFILGSAAQFYKKGLLTKGFNAVLSSDVPIGAGLSSSAAIECATVFALDQLLQTQLEKLELVKMAQKAEHEYAGVLCGIMDQFASMMGKANHVIKLDCQSLDYTYIPFKLDGFKIVLFNTNVKHSLASTAYNTRRIECLKAVEFIHAVHPNVLSLRDATIEQLNQFVLPYSPIIYQRARFVVDEIQRLEQACQYLQENQLNALGQLMYQTHDGLSKQYEVSCKELDFLVDFVKPFPSVIGARMMGGGFGGCTINLVQSNDIDQLVSAIQPAYEGAMGLPLDVYIASIADGTSQLLV